MHVRDVAAAPPLSVRLDGRLVKEGLRESDEWSVATAPGDHTIAFESGAAIDPLIASTDINLEEGAAKIV